MATLEKIRSWSVFLFIIIIVALLAFIMGDFLNSGRSLFGNPTTIAKAGGVKIDYNDYSERLNEISQAQQSAQRDNDELSQQVIEQLVIEALLRKNLDELGIKVTDNELTTLVNGETPNPQAAQFFGTIANDLGLVDASASTVYDVIKNPAHYNFTADQLNGYAQQRFQAPTLAAAWRKMESDLEKNIEQQVYFGLLNGLFTANNLDAQSLYNDNMATSVIAFVSTPVSTVPDEEVEVSDAEIKAKWNERKQSFRLTEPVRLVDYVLVNIEPSQADYFQAENEVAQAVAELQTAEGLGTVAANTKFSRKNATLPVSKFASDPELRQIPDSLIAPGKVYLSPLAYGTNTYTIAKVTDVFNEIDSIQIATAQFATVAEADSVMSLIKGGYSIDEYIAANPDSARPATWYTLIGDNQTNSALKDSFKNKPIGQPFVYSDTIQGPGAVIFNIAARKAPVRVADVTVLNYIVEASNNTVADLKTTLNSFLASNSKGDAFSANADSLYVLQHTNVSASSPHIANVPDSRQAVKWAMKAKKGEVSKVFESPNKYYLVVAVKDAYEGFIPYTDQNVKDQLTAEIKAEKKGEKIAKEYAGKATDLAGYAELLNASVQTDSAFVFTRQRFDAPVQGAIAAAQPGKLVGPVKADDAVVFFVVDGTTSEGRPFDAKMDGSAYTRRFGMTNLPQLLLGTDVIENRSLDFIVDK